LSEIPWIPEPKDKIYIMVYLFVYRLVSLERGNVMKKRFRDVADEIIYEDLVKMKADLETGGAHLKGFINGKILEIEREEVKCCATCGTPINPHYIDDFSLTFGRYDFKKRAFFCGLDCLNFFIANLDRKGKEKLTKAPQETAETESNLD
jgi:hypothetical protein